MDDLWICQNISCSVYVFGASAGGVCPDCGLDGKKMTPDQAVQLTRVYREVQGG